MSAALIAHSALRVQTVASVKGFGFIPFTNSLYAGVGLSSEAGTDETGPVGVSSLVGRTDAEKEAPRARGIPRSRSMKANIGAMVAEEKFEAGYIFCSHKVFENTSA